MKQTLPSNWNLSLLFSSDTDSTMAKERKAIEKQNKKFIAKWKPRSDYLSSPKILKEALDEYEELQKIYGQSGKEGYYFWLKSNIDENDPEVKARKQKIDDFSNKLKNEIQFFELALTQIPKDVQKTLLSSKELPVYKHYLERLFSKSSFVLSEKEERVENLLTQTSFLSWVNMLSGFLSKEERKVPTSPRLRGTSNFSEIMTLMNHKEKKIRDSAANAFNEILLKHADTAEAEINAVLGFKKVDDELRGYSRPDQMRHVEDDIDTTAIDTLLQTVSSRYDLSQRFYSLKAKLLNLPMLSYHERNVEYGEVDKEYSYEEGVALVQKVMGNLDPSFLSIFMRLLENGQVDVFPKKGKRGGAFCVYWLKSLPTFVLLNYTNTLLDVTTLAHEMGHAINNELLKEKQHALDFGTPTSTAEVASTFMEDFVFDEILKTADDELKLAILMTKLNGDISAIFRQVACYKFEQDLHSAFQVKGYLSYTEVGILFQKRMAEYMGTAVEQSAGAENWWIYWGHIRMFFYVYSYAGGLLISKAMQNGVRKDHKFIEKVKEFLSSGMSASPKDIFKRMDIDITDKSFWESGLAEIERLLEETETLAKKLHKM